MLEPVTEEYIKARQVRDAQSDRTGLKPGGGGGTLPPMETVDAKIAAAEARTDTKFAELRGDLKDFASKGTVWGAMATAVAVILAALAFAGDRFDAGVGAGGALAPYAADQKARDDAQDKKLDLILERLPTPQSSAISKP